MNLNSVTLKESMAAKAEFVRAFYDAADRLVAAQRNGQPGSDQEAAALQEFRNLIDRAKDMGSDEFTVAIQNAADEYFSRMSQAEGQHDQRRCAPAEATPPT